MVLYAHGGVYLDNDAECFAPLEPSLAGLDLALNCESAPGERDAASNAAVASAARSPFWLAVMREALRRAGDPAYIAHDNGAPAGGGPVGGRSLSQRGRPQGVAGGLRARKAGMLLPDPA
jgi:hypothetical protein